ncbi:hypothetical protein OC835_003312 [Tilletia horrida]|nr:hypothetical protein OC835_003312 [Tilletia horrida]KAK0556798.1 hypothetical protein OC844_005755 [Tilletia horrida]
MDATSAPSIHALIDLVNLAGEMVAAFPQFQSRYNAAYKCLMAGGGDPLEDPLHFGEVGHHVADQGEPQQHKDAHLTVLNGARDQGQELKVQQTHDRDQQQEAIQQHEPIQEEPQQHNDAHITVLSGVRDQGQELKVQQTHDRDQQQEAIQQHEPNQEQQQETQQTHGLNDYELREWMSDALQGPPHLEAPSVPLQQAVQQSFQQPSEQHDQAQAEQQYEDFDQWFSDMMPTDPSQPEQPMQQWASDLMQGFDFEQILPQAPQSEPLVQHQAPPFVQEPTLPQASQSQSPMQQQTPSSAERQMNWESDAFEVSGEVALSETDCKHILRMMRADGTGKWYHSLQPRSDQVRRATQPSNDPLAIRVSEILQQREGTAIHMSRLCRSLLDAARGDAVIAKDLERFIVADNDKMVIRSCAYDIIQAISEHVFVGFVCDVSDDVAGLLTSVVSARTGDSATNSITVPTSPFSAAARDLGPVVFLPDKKFPYFSTQQTRLFNPLVGDKRAIHQLRSTWPHFSVMRLDGGNVTAHQSADVTTTLRAKFT